MEYRISIDGELIEDRFKDRDSCQRFFNELVKNLMANNYPFKNAEIIKVM